MTNQQPFREKTYDVIFGTGTPGGRLFDIVLLITILGSVTAVVLESVPGIAARHRPLLRGIEWGFTIAFTLEYAVRLYCVKHPTRYALSFFGIIDLLALLPAYVSLVFAGSQSMAVIRVVRILRVFRVLKLTHFLGEAHVLRSAMRSSLPKIIVFLGAVLTFVVIVGAIMHMVEGRLQPGLESIPAAMYWAVVTLTTVGYGDVVPVTTFGKFLAASLMITGYGIIAVPTGIVTADLVSRRDAPNPSTHSCRSCLSVDHRHDAVYCRKCGMPLNPPEDAPSDQESDPESGR